MKNEALEQAARLLVEQLLRTRKDELFVITDDTQSAPEVTRAILDAAAAAGAQPLAVRVPAPRGVAAETDRELPAPLLGGILAQADIWVELNARWLLYSGPYYHAKKTNPKLRHMCLTGVSAETLIRCVGQINYPVMRRFSERLRDKIAAADTVRMTAPCGDTVTFRNVPGRPLSCKLGDADVPGTHLFVGQIGWTPALETINGTICIDGSIAPDLGILQEAIHIEVKNGAAVSLYGGNAAQAFQRWLEQFGHPQMLRIAHTGIGFNPGARRMGDILQDQRIWGSITWGFGSISAAMMPPDGAQAPSHSDAVALRTSVFLDERPLWVEGELADPDLKKDGEILKQSKF